MLQPSQKIAVKAASPVMVAEQVAAVPRSVNLRGAEPATDVFPAAMLEKRRVPYQLLMADAEPDGRITQRVRAVLNRSAQQNPPPYTGFSTLRTAEGAFRMSPPLELGSQIKYRLALAPNGRLVGIKEARIGVKSWRQGRRTSTRNVTSLSNLQHELNVQAQIGTPLRPTAVYVVDRKVYQITQAMSGDMHTFMMLMADADVIQKPLAMRAVARSMLLQAGEELRTLHGQGLIHRDIKPENILWDACGRVRLADFGYVYAGDKCGVEAMVGTHIFRAPELVFGEPWHDHYTRKVDIFGLGLSIASLFADLRLLPAERAQNRAQEAQAAFVFKKWRLARSLNGSDSGPLNWSCIAEGALLAGLVDVRHDLDLFALQFHDGDARLCDLVFQTMLVTNPAHRYGIAPILALARPMLTSAQSCTANHAFGVAAMHDARRTGFVQALRHFANHV